MDTKRKVSYLFLWGVKDSWPLSESSVPQLDEEDELLHELDESEATPVENLTSTLSAIAANSGSSV